MRSSPELALAALGLTLAIGSAACSGSGAPGPSSRAPLPSETTSPAPAGSCDYRLGLTALTYVGGTRSNGQLARNAGDCVGLIDPATGNGLVTAIAHGQPFFITCKDEDTKDIDVRVLLAGPATGDVRIASPLEQTPAWQDLYARLAPCPPAGSGLPSATLSVPDPSAV